MADPQASNNNIRARAILQTNEISYFNVIAVDWPQQALVSSVKIHVSYVKCEHNVPVNSKTAHAPPPGQTPGHLTFLKNFGKIPRYVASLDGQMLHPFELQRGSNLPPSRHVKATVKQVLQTNFSLSSCSACLRSTL